MYYLLLTRNWYEKKSVRNCMSNASETGVGFLVLAPISSKCVMGVTSKRHRRHLRCSPKSKRL